MPDRPTVGLVIAGAGARGAYEAGALAVLLPRLEEQDLRPSVLVGTSAGAINASYLAAKLHLGAEAATEGLLALWHSLHKPELLGPLAVTAVPALLGYAGRIAYLKNRQGQHRPLRTLPGGVRRRAVGNWAQIRANIGSGELHAVGVVATAAESGGSVVFLQGADGSQPPPPDDKKGIRYVPAQLRTDHVIASSSIPVLFPPKHIRGAASGPGGGTGTAGLA